MLGVAPLGALPLGGLPEGGLPDGSIPYSLTAAAGSFTETGQAATLKTAAKIGAACGAFVLTGQAAPLTATLRFQTLLTGLYTLTGRAAEFLTSKTWTKQDCSRSKWTKADEDCNCD